MANLNLGAELKALVTTADGLIRAVSDVRGTLEQGREKLPMATEKLDKIAGETESATQQVMDILDALQESDSAAAELISRMEPLAAASPETAEIIEGMKTIIDRNQRDHTRILETLQFQDLTTQQINYVNSLLEKVEDEMVGLLRAFGAPAVARPAGPAKAFDSKASYSVSVSEQAQVDSILAEARKNGNG
jgi:chemotaxis regulatin CheY-phosphate phosphatase CheZ